MALRGFSGTAQRDGFHCLSDRCPLSIDLACSEFPFSMQMCFSWVQQLPHGGVGSYYVIRSTYRRYCTYGGMHSYACNVSDSHVIRGCTYVFSFPLHTICRLSLGVVSTQHSRVKKGAHIELHAFILACSRRLRHASLWLKACHE